jgi:X-X-X-Leu-X-X-Gly heptad repeat protein
MGRVQVMPTLDAPSATGTPLPNSLRHSLEAAHGCELAAVRVHEGHEAVHLGAQAFVRGTDIYFAPGQTPPPHAEHEAWHVVQQVSQSNANVSQATSGTPALADGLVEVGQGSAGN